MRYQDKKTKAYRILDLTSFTIDEFEQLVQPFKAAFVRYIRDWTIEGKPPSGHRYSQYANCPLPTPQDRLLFILSYLKLAALQVTHLTITGIFFKDRLCCPSGFNWAVCEASAYRHSQSCC
jgi:hypothetical protein